ncbi:hypothetical protein AA12717_1650 [Gluconacetobacter sacchari DSM 12717]|uniref:Uncharacterized protein n=1 Tax=Gluconacetobacter sacchari DSM 12717 TaxID=1307940 RepID=A0ABQ0P6B3_9PROT|nr:hypothetical protein AA12717_1650 [Gluconacetobacter sacchari DSM 12717]
MRRGDRDGIVSEAATLLAEIQSDVERLNVRAQSVPQMPDALRQGIAALADKIDALCDLSRR